MEKAHVVYVSGNMFPLFGLEPAVGRLLAPADDRGPGLAPYAVLSWDYWNHRFGRDPRVLGRSLHIGAQTLEIIGVPALAISLEPKRELSPTSLCLLA